MMGLVKRMSKERSSCALAVVNDEYVMTKVQTIRSEVGGYTLRQYLTEPMSNTRGSGDLSAYDIDVLSKCIVCNTY